MTVALGLLLLVVSGTGRTCDQLIEDIVRVSAHGDSMNAAELTRAFARQCRSAPLIVDVEPDPHAAWWCRRPSSPFGVRRDPFSGEKSFHEGVDIPATNGEPLGNPFHEEATIIDAGWRGGLGFAVTIAAGGVELQIAHCSSLLIDHGTAKPNQPLCRAGSTGRSTGPHVHAAAKVGGRLTDPLPYLRGACAPRAPLQLSARTELPRESP